ncbi:MAG: Rrf2 family transcriptional regulator [Bdellovibrio sp.]
MIDQRFAVSVHIMTVLAFHKGELMTSEQLAASIGTNPTVIRRLSSKLVEAGLVSSFKGKSGGICLAKSAREISLKDIYKAIGDKRLIACPEKEPFKQCEVSCSMGEIFDEVVEGLEKQSMSYLAGIRLADVAAKVAR